MCHYRMTTYPDPENDIANVDYWPGRYTILGFWSVWVRRSRPGCCIVPRDALYAAKQLQMDAKLMS